MVQICILPSQGCIELCSCSYYPANVYYLLAVMYVRCVCVFTALSAGFYRAGK